MKLAVAYRLIWKEYRKHRGYSAWVLGAAVVALVLGHLVDTVGVPIGLDLLTIAAAASACHSLGCGVVAFSDRHAADAESLHLVFQPALRIAGIAVALLTSVAGCALLFVTAQLLGFESLSQSDALVFGQMQLFSIETFCWGILGGLVGRSAGRGLFLGTLGMYLVSYAAEPAALSEFNSLRTACLLAVIVAILGLSFTPSRPAHLVRKLGQDGWTHIARGIAKSAARPSVAFRRRPSPSLCLLWRQWRDTRWDAALLLLAAGILAMSSHVVATTTGLAAPLLATLVISFAMGTQVFRPSAHQPRDAKLIEQGIGPITLWCGRQCVWIGHVVLALLIAVSVDRISEKMAIAANTNHGRSMSFELVDVNSGPPSVVDLSRLDVGDIQPTWTLMLTGSMAMYALGQFVSLLVGHVTTVVATGGLVAVLMWRWVTWMHGLEVPIAIFLVPIPVALLLATFACCGLHMLPGRRRRRLFVVLLIPSSALAAVAAAVIHWRAAEVTSYPAVRLESATLPPSDYEVNRTSIAEDRKAALPSALEDSRDPHERHREQLRAWLPQLAADKNCLGECLTAQQAKQLVRDMLDAAETNQSRGRLDAALDDYLLALRFTGRFAQGQRWNGYLTARCAAAEIVEKLARWSSAAGQTSERVKAAIRLVDDIQQTFPPPSDCIRVEYEVACRKMEDDRLHGGSTAGSVIHLVSGRSEDCRARLVLDAIAAASFDRMEQMQVALAAGMAVDTSGPDHREFPWRWLRTTPMPHLPAVCCSWHAVPSYLAGETEIRGWLVAMALAAYEIDHGRLPTDLSALAGTYLRQVPDDPWSGDSFEYRPGGFEMQVKFPNHTFQPHQPALWSVGRLGAQVVSLDADCDGRCRLVVKRSECSDHPATIDEPPKCGTGRAFPLPH